MAAERPLADRKHISYLRLWLLVALPKMSFAARNRFLHLARVRPVRLTVGPRRLSLACSLPPGALYQLCARDYC
jgi:hypothetical protein